MELFRGLKYAFPMAILLWVVIFIGFKLILQEEQHGLQRLIDKMISSYSFLIGLTIAVPTWLYSDHPT